MTHPVLRARYADVVLDLGATINAGAKREGVMGTRALEAYLDTARMPTVALDDAFRAAARALGLAITLNNQARCGAARAVILDLDRRSKAAGLPWSDAYDILVGQPKSGITDQERADLIAGQEAGLARCSNPSVADLFDPHYVQPTGGRLTSSATMTNGSVKVAQLARRSTERWP